MDDFIFWGLMIVMILEFLLTGLIHYLIGREMSQAYLDRKDRNK